ncbi:hypothetical protein [Polyangium sp. 15x6]|uniref:hypothetical protein n=1 Tax=Polyangium sp. 15x6 TaxID=3042687 RepID=UPI00249C1035|nr:hypothetical protein [Polyangium sp. 15x6]MDI3282554.1 hypothetical protein [Polyangium sp. 15x6]
MHEEIDPQYEQKRRDLTRKGKFALFMGFTVALIGGITFASFALMALFGHSLFHVKAEAQGLMTLGFAAFLYLLGIVLMVAGGLVALGGIAVLLFANTGRMMKFQAAGTLPVARAVVRQVNAMHQETRQDPERRGP